MAAVGGYATHAEPWPEGVLNGAQTFGIEGFPQYRDQLVAAYLGRREEQRPDILTHGGIRGGTDFTVQGAATVEAARRAFRRNVSGTTMTTSWRGRRAEMNAFAAGSGPFVHEYGHVLDGMWRAAHDPSLDPAGATLTQLRHSDGLSLAEWYQTFKSDISFALYGADETVGGGGVVEWFAEQYAATGGAHGVLARCGSSVARAQQWHERYAALLPGAAVAGEIRSGGTWVDPVIPFERSGWVAGVRGSADSGWGDPKYIGAGGYASGTAAADMTFHGDGSVTVGSASGVCTVQACKPAGALSLRVDVTVESPGAGADPVGGFIRGAMQSASVTVRQQLGGRYPQAGTFAHSWDISLLSIGDGASFQVALLTDPKYRADIPAGCQPGMRVSAPRLFYS